MIDLEDEKERILEQLAAMVADASVKPELRLKAAGMVLGHERGKAVPAKDEGAAEPEVLRITLRQVEQKVDLDDSSILRQLRQLLQDS